MYLYIFYLSVCLSINMSDYSYFSHSIEVSRYSSSIMESEADSWSNQCWGTFYLSFSLIKTTSSSSLWALGWWNIPTKRHTSPLCPLLTAYCNVFSSLFRSIPNSSSRGIFSSNHIHLLLLICYTQIQSLIVDCLVTYTKPENIESEEPISEWIKIGSRLGLCIGSRLRWSRLGLCVLIGSRLGLCVLIGSRLGLCVLIGSRLRVCILIGSRLGLVYNYKLIFGHTHKPHPLLIRSY